MKLHRLLSVGLLVSAVLAWFALEGVRPVATPAPAGETDSSEPAPTLAYRPLQESWLPAEPQSGGTVAMDRRIEDRLRPTAVLARQTNSFGGRHRERSLLEIGGKYPLAVVYREWEDGPGSRLRAEFVYAAGHILVAQTEGETREAFFKSIVGLGFPSVHPLGDTGVFRVELADADLESVDRALLLLSGTGDAAGRQAEPDFMVFSAEEPEMTRVFTSKVAFQPTTVGAQSGVLRILSNDPENPEVFVPVSDTATGIPSITLDPPVLQAGIVQGTLGTETFTVRNTGQANLDWQLVRVDGVDETLPEPVTTTDPMLPELWGLLSADSAGIDAWRAWNTSTGSPSVMVAVIDTGVDLTHPDLVANLHLNTAEVAGNGVDDDANGYIDDVFGWNFYDNNNTPIDLHGHGSHVAGTIAAEGDNALGVVGVAWTSTILPVRFLGPRGGGFTSDAILAVQYARSRGARILNASWGGGGYSQLLLDAINSFASANQGLLIAAAGNNGTDNDTHPFYPANYASPAVVSVAATRQDDQLASFSNYGKSTVHVAAPGESIPSTYRDGKYAIASGTSMAAPHVSGTLALMIAHHSQLDGQSHKESLLSHVDYSAGLNGQLITDGRINACRAIEMTPSSWLAPDQTMGTLPAGESQTVTLTMDATALDVGFHQSNLAFTSNDPSHPFLDLPVHLQVHASGGYYGWAREFLGQSNLFHIAEVAVWGQHSDGSGDGVPNLIKYVTGRLPFENSSHPVLGITSLAGRPAIGFQLRMDLTGVDWALEWSESLAVDSWSSADIRFHELSRDDGAGIIHMEAFFDEEFSLVPDNAFFRLRAVESP